MAIAGDLPTERTTRHQYATQQTGNSHPERKCTPPEPTTPTTEPNEVKLHISNVYMEVSPDDLRQAFGSYGHVVEALMLKRPNPRNKSCRGAFVRMSPVSAGVSAMAAMDGTKWHGFSLRVRVARNGVGSGGGAEDE